LLLLGFLLLNSRFLRLSCGASASTGAAVSTAAGVSSKIKSSITAPFAAQGRDLAGQWPLQRLLAPEVAASAA
jgi:hypothetical protein